MKWMTITLFIIGSFSNFIFLFFSLTFFFHPQAKSTGFGLLFLIVFLYLASKKDTGVLQTWRDFRNEMKFLNENILVHMEVNERFLFRKKKFIKKRELIKNFKQRKGIS